MGCCDDVAGWRAGLCTWNACAGNKCQYQSNINTDTKTMKMCGGRELSEGGRESGTWWRVDNIHHSTWGFKYPTETWSTCRLQAMPMNKLIAWIIDCAFLIGFLTQCRLYCKWSVMRIGHGAHVTCRICRLVLQGYCPQCPGAPWLDVCEFVTVVGAEDENVDNKMKGQHAHAEGSKTLSWKRWAGQQRTRTWTLICMGECVAFLS